MVAWPVITGKRMRQAVLSTFLEISRAEKRGKHFHKETHRPRAAGNIVGIVTVSPQDNVNIRLGFVIGNYFSLLRSLFSDVIPVTMLAVEIPRWILKCAPAAASFTQSLRAESPPTPYPLGSSPKSFS